MLAEPPRGAELPDGRLESPSLKCGRVGAQEFYDVTCALWKDSGVQLTFERSNEYQLIDCAK